MESLTNYACAGIYHTTMPQTQTSAQPEPLNYCCLVSTVLWVSMACIRPIVQQPLINWSYIWTSIEVRGARMPVKISTITSRRWPLVARISTNTPLV